MIGACDKGIAKLDGLMVQVSLEQSFEAPTILASFYNYSIIHES
jgi:hypothetical protein